MQLSAAKGEPDRTKCPRLIESVLQSWLAAKVVGIIRRELRVLSMGRLSIHEKLILTQDSIILVHGLRGHPYETWASSKIAGDERVVGTSNFHQKIKSHFKPSSESNSTQKGASSRQEEAVFWPQDYLVKDVSQARVWTYGYNADVIGGLFQANNKNSVSGHGRDLAVRLERDVENEVIQPVAKRRKTRINGTTIRTRSYSWPTALAASLSKT